jgi:hypothetical protein
MVSDFPSPENVENKNDDNPEFGSDYTKVTLQTDQGNEIRFDGWEAIGFQRPLGGWMFGFSISLLTSLFGVVTIGFITRLLYPWPEQKGYYDVANALFLVIYQFFDFGTAFGISRFIAEYRVKNTKKMLEYIRFFVWYQMFTGLIQVTILSLFIFRVTIFNPQFSYLTWIFLIILQKQWPGMLGTWKSSIDGLQHHNKTQILNFITGDVFQMATNVIFILLGRAWGVANPQYGELFGATIGLALGGYIDDFFAMGLSAYYFNKLMKPFGITFRETWRFDFGKDVIRNCLWFGFQVSWVPIINTITGTWMLLMYLDALPQYTTWKVLVGFGAGIAGIVGVGDFSMTSLLAESYSSGKRKLSEFYVSFMFKWQGFFNFLLLMIVLGYYPIVVYFIQNVSGLENYQAATVFILPLLIQRIASMWVDPPNSILTASLHIGFYTFVRVFEEVLQVFFVWLFLYGFRLHEVYGLQGVVFIMAFEHFFPRQIKAVMCWIYIHKQVMHVKVYWYTTFIVPILSALPIVFFSRLWHEFMIFPLVDRIGLIPGAVITILIGIFCIPFFIYLPLTGILGGWDDYQLAVFKKGVDLSGPSRVFFVPFYKAIMKGVEFGKKLGLHGKYRIPWEDAIREINELMQAKVELTIADRKDIITKNAPWLKKSDFENATK